VKLPRGSHGKKAKEGNSNERKVCRLGTLIMNFLPGRQYGCASEKTKARFISRDKRRKGSRTFH
jgi:hypothetical protein